jgi:DNA-binding MarR family transcriptional regulator
MKDELSRELADRFTRVAGKYASLDKIPLRLANGKAVYASEMHMAIAIGEGRASTATDLASIFGVTKGAVSQAVKRLEAKGLIERKRGEGDAKTRLLSLTAEGMELPALHASAHGKNAKLFEGLERKYTIPRMKEIIDFLGDAESLLDALLEDGE